MRTSFPILTTILVLAGQAIAQSDFSSFVACVEYGSYDQTTGYSIGGRALRTSQQCATACSSRQEAADFGYSAWDALGNDCQCLRLGRPGQGDIGSASYKAALDASNTCDPNDISIQRLSSAWQERPATCYSVLQAQGRASLVSGPAECSSLCAKSRTMIISAYTPDNNFRCRCTDGITSATPATCDTETFYVYERSAVAAASGVYRRSLREAAKREKALKQAKFPYCPDHSQACKVTGSLEGYECIETNYELESCGGCTEGVFGMTGNSTVSGTDCTQVSGVPMGAISCLAGKCIAYACSAGWKLKKGVCTKV